MYLFPVSLPSSLFAGLGRINGFHKNLGFVMLFAVSQNFKLNSEVHGYM